MHVSKYPHISKKRCSPVFLDNYKQNKTRKETLLELELIEIFVSSNKRPDFWKSLSKIMYIIFHCRTSIIT